MKKKHWLVLFVVAILGMGVTLAYMQGLNPQGGQLVPKADIVAGQPSLELKPSTAAISLNQTADVQIYMNTQAEQIYSVDALLNYDQDYLTVADIKNGSIFSGMVVRSKVNGLININFNMGSGGNPYTGQGAIATIVFKGIKETISTPVTFQFTSGSTTDSNMVNTSIADVLAGVQDGAYSVGQAPPPPPPPPNTGGNTTPTQGTVKGANTGAVVPIVLIALLIGLATISLVFLLKKAD